MKRTAILGGGLAAVVLLGAPLRAQEAEVTRSFEVSAGDWVEIRNVVGFVTAGPASGDMVEITATKRGRRRDFDLVRVEFVENRDGITACVLYPRRNRRGVRDRSDDGSCRSGTYSNVTDDVDVRVDFVVRVPSGVNLNAGTVSGDIEADGLDAEVMGSAVSGDVYVATTGLAEANTVSGSIEAHLGRADWSGKLSFRTVSGDIRVYVPEELNADVIFSSVTGDMESDFPITISRRSGGFAAGSLRGTIGDGGRELNLNTVSGDALLMIERR